MASAAVSFRVALPGTVWVVLEQCSLETVKTKRGFELLNCDDHANACRRAKRDPADYRPDIVHQVLLALLDSPLNKAGALRVLMLTKKNVLIDVLPTTRIPRTFKRFAGLMGARMHAYTARSTTV
jgi:rRNA small subunit pseudouridine methyltransferase Nep1